MENNIDIQEINNNLQRNFIHYDPERIDYTVNSNELELLQSAGSSLWKDIFLATLGLGIPSLINAFCDFIKLSKNEQPGLDIFINSLIGGISLCLCIICLIFWRKTTKNFNKIIESIRNKPKYTLPKK